MKTFLAILGIRAADHGMKGGPAGLIIAITVVVLISVFLLAMLVNRVRKVRRSRTGDGGMPGSASPKQERR